MYEVSNLRQGRSCVILLACLLNSVSCLDSLSFCVRFKEQEEQDTAYVVELDAHIDRDSINTEAQIGELTISSQRLEHMSVEELREQLPAPSFDDLLNLLFTPTTALANEFGQGHRLQRYTTVAEAVAAMAPPEGALLRGGLTTHHLATAASR